MAVPQYPVRASTARSPRAIRAGVACRCAGAVRSRSQLSRPDARAGASVGMQDHGVAMLREFLAGEFPHGGQNLVCRRRHRHGKHDVVHNFVARGARSPSFRRRYCPAVSSKCQLSSSCFCCSEVAVHALQIFACLALVSEASQIQSWAQIHSKCPSLSMREVRPVSRSTTDINGSQSDFLANICHGDNGLVF